jgi:hypothetical protein
MLENLFFGWQRKTIAKCRLMYCKFERNIAANEVRDCTVTIASGVLRA